MNNRLFFPCRGFPSGSDSKESAWKAGNPGSGRSSEEGNRNPLQYFCLENSMDRAPWPVTVHGVTKSRTRLRHWTELNAIFYMHVKLSSFSCDSLFMILSTAANQPPLSMGFSRQEYRSGLPFPPPGDLPDPGIKSTSLALAGMFFTTRATWKIPCFTWWFLSVNPIPLSYPSLPPPPLLATISLFSISWVCFCFAYTCIYIIF